jgi:hypothetical protein
MDKGEGFRLTCLRENSDTLAGYSTVTASMEARLSLRKIASSPTGV